MPLFLLLVGIVLVVTGVRGTTAELGGLLKGDFTGEGNFTTWVAAILFAGMAGYIPGFRPISNAFLLLVGVAILLTRGRGFFDQFSQAMKELNT